MFRRRAHTLGLVVALAGPVSLAGPADSRSDDRVYFDCPCTLSSDGTTLTASLGLRSFRATATGSISLVVRALASQDANTLSGTIIATIPLVHSVGAEATVAAASYQGSLTQNASLAGNRYLLLSLQESGRWRPGELLYMEHSVDIDAEFSVGELNYVQDSDGDGVGDVNEGIMNTDPEDAASVPRASTLDVLAFYSQSFPALYDGDATTRIQHVVAMANTILRDSGVPMKFRIVGTVPVEIDEDKGGLDEDLMLREAARHGADLKVLFRPKRPNESLCGFAPLGGVASRGYLAAERERTGYATVIGNCGADTFAHEMGHRMGLHHSAWQNSTGTWRWARGHAVDNDFGTVMTYGPRGGGRRLAVFSDPGGTCRGSLATDSPCGKDAEEIDGADAVAALNAVRIQVAKFGAWKRDTDRDGFVDPVDDLPDDASDWLDTDSDGIGNKTDTDDDGDAVGDAVDVFPLDAGETVDTDGDGVGDNGDPFPEDATETADTDGDGVGDNADRFPLDPTETADGDGDGVGDNGDAFPEDPAEHTDTDSDGIGDAADADDDNDGADDVVDLFPLDSTKTDISSYLFLGEGPGDRVGRVLSPAGGSGKFIVGASEYGVGDQPSTGAVYLVTYADLPVMDAADGAVDRIVGLGAAGSGSASWKIVGEGRYQRAGYSVASEGDMDGDGLVDLLVGAPWHAAPERRWSAGAVYFLSGGDFAAADAADGTDDRTIHLEHVAAQSRSWKFLGASAFDVAGTSIAAAGDLDDDAKSDFLIGASYFDGDASRSDSGAVYIVASGDLAAADSADGTQDGVVDLSNIAGQANSWCLIGENAEDRAGQFVASHDVDGDGRQDVLVAAPTPHFRTEGTDATGAAYLVMHADLAAADGADGSNDGVVDLGNVASQPRSWKLVGATDDDGARVTAISALGDIDSDGSTELLLSRLHTYLFSVADLQAADAADGDPNGTVDLLQILARDRSWRFAYMRYASSAGDLDGDGAPDLLLATGAGVVHLLSSARLASADAQDHTSDRVINWWHLSRSRESWTVAPGTPTDSLGSDMSQAGDIDGDGLTDSLLGAPGPWNIEAAGAAYLVLSTDLQALDAADDADDLTVHLGNFAGDTDADGVGNIFDRDDDNDAVPDSRDAFPLDPSEWADTDRDRVGDNADAFPNDPYEQTDTDRDGIGDRADTDDDGDGQADGVDEYPLDTNNDGVPNSIDEDDDGDGVSDIHDALPVDPDESVDTDRDGVGNNADPDDDNDGVEDADDAFPLDPLESVDSDADGVGDNSDVFPNDPDEVADNDGDGIGDAADTDDDNDGVADTSDDFPFDPSATRDTDADGVPDSRDAFPQDPAEWADADGDGVGDVGDTDDDNDGVADTTDLFPLDASRWELTSVVVVAQEHATTSTWTVGGAADVDGDGQAEILLGSKPPASEGEGLAYLLSTRDLSSADQADGRRDGTISEERIATQQHSWKLVGEPGFVIGGSLSPVGDLDADGGTEIAVGADARAGALHLVSGADLTAADASDGEADGSVRLGALASQAGSWMVTGTWQAQTGTSVSLIGDIDGDGRADVSVQEPGACRGEQPGTLHVLAASALPAFDALDGDTDGALDVSRLAGQDGYRRLLGERSADRAATQVEAADFDGDGLPDLLIAAPDHDVGPAGEGTVYLVGSSDVSGVDAADGTTDGTLELARTSGAEHSWQFVGGSSWFWAPERRIATGDVDGDGQPDLVFNYRDNGMVVDVISGTETDLTRVDAADGTEDRVIDLRHVGSTQRTWRFVAKGWWGSGSIDLIDADADGLADLLIGIRSPSPRVAHLIAGSSFANGEHGTLSLAEPPSSSSSYEFRWREPDRSYRYVNVASLDDVDGDGLGDLAIAVQTDEDGDVGEAYVIFGADLPFLDSADSVRDSVVHLDQLQGALR